MSEKSLEERVGDLENRVGLLERMVKRVMRLAQWAKKLSSALKAARGQLVDIDFEDKDE